MGATTFRREYGQHFTRPQATGPIQLILRLPLGKGLTKGMITPSS